KARGTAARGTAGRKDDGARAGQASGAAGRKDPGPRRPGRRVREPRAAAQRPRGPTSGVGDELGEQCAGAGTAEHLEGVEVGGGECLVLDQITEQLLVTEEGEGVLVVLR